MSRLGSTSRVPSERGYVWVVCMKCWFWERKRRKVNLGGQKRFCVAFLGLGCGNKREEGVK